MKWLYSIILGLMLMATPNICYAQGAEKFVVPHQTILGADEPVPPGDIVILKISQISLKDKPQYLKEVQYHWTVLRNGKKIDRFIAWPDNSSLVFGAGNDTKADIKVLLSIAYRYEVVEEIKDKDGKVTGKVIKESAMRLAEPVLAQIRVGDGPNPPNPPGPGPDPVNPDPVFPNGKYGLSKTTYDATKTVNLDSASKQRSATALSNNYKGLASAVRAGTIKTPTDLLQKTAKGNTDALKSVNVLNNEWQAWDDAVQRVLIRLNKVDKTMVAISDFADAWDEIAAGLAAVK